MSNALETARMIGETILVVGAVVGGAWRVSRKTGQVLDRVNGMWAEMHPNSGSSMRDAIDRTEAVATATKTALDAHIGRCGHG